jgi:2,3-bisphosphoglycerate-independent phosphoglycerate mutase
MKPLMLIILDGFGMREEIHGNAIKQANMPNFNYLWNNYPHSLLNASGEYVGLPSYQMGNSEVGHTNIGAGRIVYQPLQIINNSISDGSIYNNAKLLKIINHVKENDSKLHIMGLLSDGGVHSHIDHIFALIDIAKYHDIKKIYIHAFMDGRDTLPNIGNKFIVRLNEKLEEIKLGAIATIEGRYYVMDRDNNWDRTKKAYDAMVNGIGNYNTDSSNAMMSNYQQGIYDEFIIPTVVDKEGMIDSNDSIIFANFRTDRAVQIIKAITDPDFKEFETKKLNNIKTVLLMPAAKLPNTQALFESTKLENKLGEYLANLDYTQLRIAETEKYAHVTYFFDGLEDKELKGCTKILIPSPKVKTYDLKPEMSAYEITDELLKQLKSNTPDFIVLNFANCDMVGHTGNMDATIKAIEAVDKCLGKIFDAIKEMNGLLIVTADHGNAEYMLDDHNNEITAHTMNKVPFIICNNNFKIKDGKLGDIAPTILTILNEKTPSEMTGNILIEK